MTIASKELFQLKIDKTDWTIEKLVKQVLLGNITFDSDSLNKSNWTDAKQSYYIETIILGFPLHPIILSQDDEDSGILRIVDGNERINAIMQFQQCDKPLQSLKVRTDLNCRYYQSIQYDYRNADITASFDRQLLNLIIVQKCSNKILDQIKTRLNS